MVDEWVDVHDYEEVFFRVGANVDPKRDVLDPRACSTTSTMRPRSSSTAERSASTRPTRAPKREARPWPEEIVMSEEIQRLVDERWGEYGLGGDPGTWTRTDAGGRCANCYVVDVAIRATIEPVRLKLTGRRTGWKTPRGKTSSRSFDRRASGRWALPSASSACGWAWWSAGGWPLFGAALALLFGFLWARDVTTGGKAAPVRGAGRGRACWYEGEAVGITLAPARRALPAQQDSSRERRSASAR